MLLIHISICSLLTWLVMGAAIQQFGDKYFAVELEKIFYSSNQNRRIPARQELFKRNRITKRQSLFNQPLTNRLYYYTIHFTLGTPPQDFNIHLDTGSSDIWVSSISNPYCRESVPNNTTLNPKVRFSCAEQGLFDSNRSSTYKSKADYLILRYGDNSYAAGEFGSDVLQVNGGAISIKNMEFIKAYEADTLGVFGIGMPELEVSAHRQQNPFEYKNFPIRLKDAGLIDSVAYSMWLNAPTASSGLIVFGGIDTGKYTGPLVTIDLVPTIKDKILEFTVPATYIKHYTSPCDEPTVLSSVDIVVLADVGSTSSYLPAGVVTGLADKLQLTVDDDGDYIRSCNYHSDDDQYITIKISKFDLKIPINDLMLPKTNAQNQPLSSANGDPICYLGIYPSDDLKFCSLGDNILRSAYLVFDIENKRLGLAQTKIKDYNSGQILGIKPGKNGIPGAIQDSLLPPGSHSCNSSLSTTQTSRYSSSQQNHTLYHSYESSVTTNYHSEFPSTNNTHTSSIDISSISSTVVQTNPLSHEITGNSTFYLSNTKYSSTGSKEIDTVSTFSAVTYFSKSTLSNENDSYHAFSVNNMVSKPASNTDKVYSTTDLDKYNTFSPNTASFFPSSDLNAAQSKTNVFTAFSSQEVSSNTYLSYSLQVTDLVGTKAAASPSATNNHGTSRTVSKYEYTDVNSMNVPNSTFSLTDKAMDSLTAIPSSHVNSYVPQTNENPDINPNIFFTRLSVSVSTISHQTLETSVNHKWSTIINKSPEFTSVTVSGDTYFSHLIHNSVSPSKGSDLLTQSQNTIASFDPTETATVNADPYISTTFSTADSSIILNQPEFSSSRPRTETQFGYPSSTIDKLSETKTHSPFSSSETENISYGDQYDSSIVLKTDSKSNIPYSYPRTQTTTSIPRGYSTIYSSTWDSLLGSHSRSEYYIESDIKTSQKQNASSYPSRYFSKLPGVLFTTRSNSPSTNSNYDSISGFSTSLAPSSEVQISQKTDSKSISMSTQKAANFTIYQFSKINTVSYMNSSGVESYRYSDISPKPTDEFYSNQISCNDCTVAPSSSKPYTIPTEYTQSLVVLPSTKLIVSATSDALKLDSTRHLESTGISLESEPFHTSLSFDSISANSQMFTTGIKSEMEETKSEESLYTSTVSNTQYYETCTKYPCKPDNTHTNNLFSTPETYESTYEMSSMSQVDNNHLIDLASSPGANSYSIATQSQPDRTSYSHFGLEDTPFDISLITMSNSSLFDTSLEASGYKTKMGSSHLSLIPYTQLNTAFQNSNVPLYTPNTPLTSILSPGYSNTKLDTQTETRLYDSGIVSSLAPSQISIDTHNSLESTPLLSPSKLLPPTSSVGPPSSPSTSTETTTPVAPIAQSNESVANISKYSKLLLIGCLICGFF